MPCSVGRDGGAEGLRLEYFRHPGPFSKATAVELDGVPGSGSTTPFVDLTPPVHVRWTGALVIGTSGLHQVCFTKSSSNDTFTLTIAGAGSVLATGCLSFTAGAGQLVPLAIEGDRVLPLSGFAQLTWTPPGATSASIIPPSALRSGLAPCVCPAGGACETTCTATKPCLSGQGTCAPGATCLGSSSCALDVGSSYGLAATEDVCIDTCLGRTGNGLMGTYAAGLELSPVLFSRVDPNVDFAWLSTPPGPGLTGTTPFSVEWRGELRPLTTGVHQLCVISSSLLRLSVDGLTAAHTQGTNNCARRWLTAGGRVPIAVQFKNTSNASTVRLSWIQPGATVATPVPQSVLFVGGTDGGCGP